MNPVRGWYCVRKKKTWGIRRTCAFRFVNLSPCNQLLFSLSLLLIMFCGKGSESCAIGHFLALWCLFSAVHASWVLRICGMPFSHKYSHGIHYIRTNGPRQIIQRSYFFFYFQFPLRLKRFQFLRV